MQHSSPKKYNSKFQQIPTDSTAHKYTLAHYDRSHATTIAAIACDSTGKRAVIVRGCVKICFEHKSHAPTMTLKIDRQYDMMLICRGVRQYNVTNLS